MRKKNGLFYCVVLAMLFTNLSCRHSVDEVESRSAKKNDSTLSKQSAGKALDQLKAEFEGATKNNSCDQSADCRLLAIGHRPCGGPSDYWLYSNKNLQNRDFIKRAEEYNAMIEKLQKQLGVVGICVVKQKPKFACKNQACQIL